jgi:hypothetical protein
MGRVAVSNRNDVSQTLPTAMCTQVFRVQLHEIILLSVVLQRRRTHVKTFCASSKLLTENIDKFKFHVTKLYCISSRSSDNLKNVYRRILIISLWQNHDNIIKYNDLRAHCGWKMRQTGWEIKRRIRSSSLTLQRKEHWPEEELES